MDSPEAYETLILDAMLGDALAVHARRRGRGRRGASSTPIIDAWLDMPAPEFPNYAAGTWGPEAADHLIERDGRRWRRI